MVNFEKSVDENNENSSTSDNFTIGKYSWNQTVIMN